MCLRSVRHVVLFWLLQHCSLDSTGPTTTINKIFGLSWNCSAVLVPLHSVKGTLPVIKLPGVMCVCISVCSWVCTRVRALAPLRGCSRVLNYTYILIPLLIVTMKGFPAFPLLKWRDAQACSLHLPQTCLWPAGQCRPQDSNVPNNITHVERTQCVCIQIIRQKSWGMKRKYFVPF